MSTPEQGREQEGAHGSAPLPWRAPAEGDRLPPLPPPPASSGGGLPPPPVTGQPRRPDEHEQQVHQQTNGLAIAAMVLGILWLYWIGSILALVLGYVARQQIDRSGGAQSGRGLAITGIVLGWVGVGILAAVIALSIAAAFLGFLFF